jgi:DNA-binding transcriptional LysR family regulator
MICFPPMELRHLRYLVAVAEELHFGRAAIRLNISQPPLSQQIRQLEEELGVQLFQRTKREVHLTEAGKRVVNEAYQVLGRVDHFSKVAAQAGGGEIGHLSVGVPGGVNEILVATLKELGKKYPGVRIELQYMSTGLQIDALREGKIEVGFVNLPVQEPTLTVETIKRDPLWLALPQGNPLARRTSIPIALLENQPMIFFPRRVTPGLHDSITAMCRNAGFTLNVIHEVDSIVGGLTLVSAGFGVAFSTPSVQQLLPDIVFRPIEGGPFIEQAVGYRRDVQSPVLETFLTVVRKAARKTGSTKQ